VKNYKGLKPQRKQSNCSGPVAEEMLDIFEILKIRSTSLAERRSTDFSQRRRGRREKRMGVISLSASLCELSASARNLFFERHRDGPE